MYAVLARAAGAPPASPPDPDRTPAPSDTSATSADGDDWAGSSDPRFTDPSFVRDHLATRSHTVRGAALYLAERPGEWIGSEPIAEALGLPHGWNSLAGAFGAASRYFRNRDIELPWNWSYYRRSDGHVELMMDPDTAGAVQEALR